MVIIISQKEHGENRHFHQRIINCNEQKDSGSLESAVLLFYFIDNTYSKNLNFYKTWLHDLDNVNFIS